MSGLARAAPLVAPPVVLETLAPGQTHVTTAPLAASTEIRLASAQGQPGIALR